MRAVLTPNQTGLGAQNSVVRNNYSIVRRREDYLNFYHYYSGCPDRHKKIKDTCDYRKSKNYMCGNLCAYGRTKCKCGDTSLDIGSEYCCLAESGTCTASDEKNASKIWPSLLSSKSPKPHILDQIECDNGKVLKRGEKCKTEQRRGLRNVGGTCYNSYQHRLFCMKGEQWW